MNKALYEVRDGIATLTVNRPEALNALNAEVLNDLRDTLIEAAKAPPRCLILTGAGEKAFVAGADIAAMKDFSRLNAEEFSRLGNYVMNLVENFPAPVIAAVNGFALGGGCELALACDIRLCGENASFAFPEVGLGIPPGFGGMQRMVRAVGAARAKELVYTARRVKANEALALGLVSAVHPAADLMGAAQKMADSIAANAPLAVRAAKAAINEGAGMSLCDAADCEISHFTSCFETDDQKNAMTAFAEKRKPEPFTGC